MRLRLATLVLLGLTAAPIPVPADAENVESVHRYQAKELEQRYAQVEAQLDRSVRYAKKTESASGTTIERAWYNGSDDPIKLMIEQTNGPKREVATYYYADFANEAGGPLVIWRTEITQPDGTTQADETRQFYAGDGQVGRALRRSARLKPGESLDSIHIPYTAVDLDKEPAAQADDNVFFRPRRVAKEVRQSGSLEFDPFSAVTGDSAKYRVIHNTGSPDGRYAIGLGLKQEQIDWDQLKDSDHPGTYNAETQKLNDTIVNYVIDVATRTILGQTGCRHFGTLQSYKDSDCQVTWLPDSKTFVEVTGEQAGRDTDVCRAGKIGARNQLIDPVDLGEYAKKTAAAYLAKHKGDKYGGSIGIRAWAVTDNNTVLLEISGENKTSSFFFLNERIRIRETPSGLRLETVQIRIRPSSR
jgi:hypothetical protein